MSNDLLRRLAERDRPLVGHVRVDHAPAERRGVQRLVRRRVGALGLQQDPRRARHRLDASAQDQRRVAGLDGSARLDRRLETRAAEPVDGHARDAGRQAGEQRAHPPDVAVVLACPVRVAEDDVLDLCGIEVGVAVDDRLDRVRAEVVRPDAGQRAPHPAVGRSDRVEYVGGGAHDASRS
jgi:hypothetical protein